MNPRGSHGFFHPLISGNLLILEQYKTFICLFTLFPSYQEISSLLKFYRLFSINVLPPSILPPPILPPSLLLSFLPSSLLCSLPPFLGIQMNSPPLLQLNVTLEKEVAGFWVKVPCVEELGSCHYRDACDVLNQLIPPGQECPEPLHTYGLPCRCPFKDVSPLLPSFLPSFWEVERYLRSCDQPDV